MRVRKVFLLVICAMIVFNLIPLAVHAEEKEKKIVRVGWYESAFHRTDEFGRKSGYGYEYQQRIATYTGWEYEYVEGSWPELFEMLVEGKLDLLSDVSYTEERAKKVLFSSESMGNEDYHVFIAPDNQDIRPDDFSTFNGKTVIVNKDSIQEQLFRKWAKDHKVHPKIIESTLKSPDMIEGLKAGSFDMLITLDTYSNTEDIVPVCKIGSADSYFGINKKRKDLKKELDTAMVRIFEENRDFNHQLSERFNKAGGVNTFISTKDREWLLNHGTVKVGYQDDYLPFCDLDEESDEITGALSNFLDFAKTAEKNAIIDFEAKAYNYSEDSLAALAKGEVDCVFPIALSAYDGEQMGVIITDPFVSTEMYAAVRASDHEGLSKYRNMRVAVMKGMLGYDTFLKDNFPKWEPVYFETASDGFRAVADGDADCVLISNYRLNDASEMCSKYELVPLNTGEAMNLAFAVRREDDSLYSILNKINRRYSDTTKNASLTEYAVTDNRVTFIDYLRDNLHYFMLFISIIAIIILLLVINNMRADAKIREGRQIISEAERDNLTDLYNRYFFITYTNRFYREHPDEPMDAIVLNIERFHAINSVNGREFGDSILQGLGRSLKDFVKETGGLTGRVGSDSFDLYCPHQSDYQALLDRFQTDVSKISEDVDVRLRMGVMPWQEGSTPDVMFARAWSACSEAKKEYNTHLMVFNDELLKREELWQRLQNDLTGALRNRELIVYYQPKYDIKGEEAVLSSSEALVRWIHPELGLLRPDQFIPVFERSGQISALDRYVWDEAARQIAEWRDRYGRVVPVSINLSRVDIFDTDLISTLDGIVSKYGLDRTDLLLEVTESAYTENSEHVVEVVNRLREHGYKIEMDDFGSGYSSLNTLSSLPVDVLKMDMVFIQNIERNERDFRLVELILDIARYLKVPVIAEGVETKRQLMLLKNAGCDLVQGYYFSRPLPADEFEQSILNK